MSMPYEISRYRSRLLITALTLGLAGLFVVIPTLYFSTQHPADMIPEVGIVVSWFNLIIQPLCLAVVWLTRKIPRNLSLRILVWTYIIVGALYVLCPVALRYVPELHEN
jgi:hypothetical protein